MKLLIGNKNYSSWSLRPWLVLRHFNIEFDEAILLLNGEYWKQNLLERTPSGFVPVLIEGELVIDETIAIIEYLADRFPRRGIWPAEMEQRALARVCSARMHGGFSALRNAAPMNMRGDFPGRIDETEIASDMQELENLLVPLLKRFRGPFLFGEFCAADAMFAPVASRIKTYGIKSSQALENYFAAIYALRAYGEWEAAANAETWVVQQDEIDFIQASK